MKDLDTIEDLIIYLKSVNGKVRSVPNIQKQMIINATSYLPEDSKISQRIYHLINDIKEVPHCKCCNTQLDYKNLIGYGKGYCSTECYNIVRKDEKIKLREYRNSLKLNDNDSYIECKVCGEAVKAIHSHLKLSSDELHHGWDLKRYKKEFSNSPTISKNTSKILSEKISGKNNAMHSSNTTKEYRKSNSPFSKDFYIKRGFSETDAKKEVSKFVKDALKDRKCAVNLDYYIDKCNGDIKEAKNLYKDRQTTFTLEKCISKYGEVEGKRKYKERQKKWNSSLHKNFMKYGDGRSPQSKGAIMLFKSICDKLFIQNNFKKEKFIHDTTHKYGKGFSYDFQYKNKLIEYNGDYWHMNPKIYDANVFNKNKNKLAHEIWEYDNYKKKLAESYGYEVLIIWESEYNEDKEGTLKKCLEFLQK